MHVCKNNKTPAMCSVNEHAAGALFIWSSEEKCGGQSLQLGACGDQSLAVLVALVLGEVLHEAAGQILCLLFH